MPEKTENRIKTRCYYTDYVNHMIRFYLTCPDSLKCDGKRKADIYNWMAVQAVLHRMKPENRQKIVEIYSANCGVSKAVRNYCSRTQEDAYAVWVLITKTCSLIARQRGLT